MTLSETQKERVKLALKIILGMSVVIYVLRSKMVDFEMLRSVLWSPANIIVGFFFLTLVVALSAARWRLLVKAQGLSLSYVHLLELTMIGQFFNTFMPGAVGGDLMKAWYVAGRAPQQKTKAIFTVFLDRLIGLSVIILYSASTLLFYTEWMGQTPEISLIAYAIWGFSTFCLFAAILFFTSSYWKLPWGQKIIQRLQRQPIVEKLLEAIFLYRNHVRAILGALTFSAVSVLCMNLMYRFLGDRLGIELDLPHYFFIVPLALTASAIPLLPGGIGVGQVAFYNLFKWVGVANPDQGGTLCTLIQIYTILFNCFGAYFYFRFKKNPSSFPLPTSASSAVSPSGLVLSTQSPSARS